MRNRATGLAVACLGAFAAAAGCGSGNGIPSDIVAGHPPIVAKQRNASVSLTIGSGRSQEQQILGEIYTQALLAAGYAAKYRMTRGTPPGRALRAGLISAYPGYLSSTLTGFGVRLLNIPGKSSKAYRDARSALGERGLTALPPTPFRRAYVLAALRKNNEERHWINAFRLEHRSEELRAYGPPGCRSRRDCLAGLRRNYALVFGSFTSVPRRLRYRVLESGEADVSFVTTTDPQLAAERDKFVSLVDTKKALPAGNAFVVTTPRIVREAGPDYEATIVHVQGGLTVAVMQELNARVELRQDSPRRVAEQYLREAGYVRGEEVRATG